MKKQLLTAILFLFINNCIAQPIIYLDTISFEGGLQQLTIDTPLANNIWQVGKPSKIIFNSAYSPPNAIVTDTLNPYPANNISSFTIMEPFEMIHRFSFWHKYDTDQGHVGGYVEISTDKGNSWANIILDTTIKSMFYDVQSYGFYDTSQKITGGIPAFSGNSNGWNYAGFDWMQFCVDQNPHVNSYIDSIWIRFVFKSDSLQTGKEGWMIDDIRFEIDLCSGIENINAGDFKIYPNPTSDNLTLQLSGTQKEKITFQIYDVVGREVSAQSEIKNPKSEIDISSLQSGVYFLKMNDGEKMVVKKFLKE